METFTSTMPLGELLSAQGWQSTDQQNGIVVEVPSNSDKSPQLWEIYLHCFFWEKQQEDISGTINNVPTHTHTTLCTMTMCLINAQSVRNKVPQLTEYIIEHDFGIVAITETWLHNTPDDDEIIRAMQIPGYTFIHVTEDVIRMSHPEEEGFHSSPNAMKFASTSSWKAKSGDNIEVTLTASSTLKLAVIYRPPPSKINQVHGWPVHDRIPGLH